VAFGVTGRCRHVWGLCSEANEERLVYMHRNDVATLLPEKCFGYRVHSVRRALRSGALDTHLPKRMRETGAPIDLEAVAHAYVDKYGLKRVSQILREDDRAALSRLANRPQTRARALRSVRRRTSRARAPGGDPDEPDPPLGGLLLHIAGRRRERPATPTRKA
jgi:hypothetical protein